MRRISLPPIVYAHVRANPNPIARIAARFQNGVARFRVKTCRIS
jgi:hypothetical protein